MWRARPVAVDIFIFAGLASCSRAPEIMLDWWIFGSKDYRNELSGATTGNVPAKRVNCPTCWSSCNSLRFHASYVLQIE